MYLRVIGNAQGRRYLQIVRSYREAGKVKCEVLFTFGRLDVLQATGQIDSLIEALSRYATRQNLIDLSKDISIQQVCLLGAAHVVSRMMERSKLTAALKRLAAEHSKMRLPWAALITGMIVSRFISPCSKRRLNREQWDRIYPGILEVDAPPLQSFYRALDVLWEHRTDIEATLFDRAGQRDLFNDELDVVFYDMTTLYFESTDAESGTLRRFGFSKEHRNDCTQVMLGLLVDRDGVPVGYEVFPGNTYEPHSLPQILEKLKMKYRLRRLILVADRGLITRENITFLRESKMEFILGFRLWAMPQAEQERVLDKTVYRTLDADGQVLIRETRYQDDRLILSWSRERADHDAQVRDGILDKIARQMKGSPNPKRFVTHKGYRQYMKGFDKGLPQVDEQAVAESQRRDGFFGILTNVPKGQLRDDEILERYHDLWQVEAAFREIKGPFETRPMFHWVDRRIQSHVLLCLMAYYLESIMTREFRKAKATITVGEWFRSLNQVYAIPVDVRGTRAWVRNEINGTAKTGYELLHLQMPERVLKIEKIATDESVVTRISTDISKTSVPQAF